MENVLTLLTSEDRFEIKKAMKEIIVEQIKSDFESYDCYLFDPSQIQDMIEEVVDEVREEVKIAYKEKVMKEMEEKLANMKI